ncbi:ABC transporter permease subunit [bacterium]|nr:ABC transporter permease subunit [bacterium]
MIWTIIIRELMDHTKSLRLLITFLLLIALMSTGGLLFLQEHRQQTADFNRNTAETMETVSRIVDRPAALFQLFSFNWRGPFIYASPNHLGFISEGQGKNLPNAYSPSAFKLYGPYKKIRSNIFLGYFAGLDWALIFGVILSFAAIILVYDAFCGEKEQGTLRLIVAHAVPRSHLMSGKFSGALIALGIPVLLGTLIQLLIVTIGGIVLQAADITRILLSLALTFLYLSCYILIGLFISARSSSESTSLVAGLLIWALLVVVIPSTGGMIASDVVKIPTRETVYDRANTAWEEAVTSYNRDNPRISGASLSGHWSPGEPLERAIVAADAWSEVIEQFRNQQIRQVLTARAWTFVSPTAVYRSGIESAAETGIYHYRKFYRQAVDFKMTQRQFLYDHYPLPTRWFYRFGTEASPEDAAAYESLSRIPLSLRDVPVFREKRLSLADNVQASLPSFLLLFLFCALLYAAGHISFQRYDVR